MREFPEAVFRTAVQQARRPGSGRGPTCSGEKNADDANLLRSGGADVQGAAVRGGAYQIRAGGARDPSGGVAGLEPGRPCAKASRAATWEIAGGVSPVAWEGGVAPPSAAQ